MSVDTIRIGTADLVGESESKVEAKNLHSGKPGFEEGDTLERQSDLPGRQTEEAEK